LACHSKMKRGRRGSAPSPCTGLPAKRVCRCSTRIQNELHMLLSSAASTRLVSGTGLGRKIMLNRDGMKSIAEPIQKKDDIARCLVRRATM
jgi:hypothetical protein